jgi:hypothetical protein
LVVIFSSSKGQTPAYRLSECLIKDWRYNSVSQCQLGGGR